jgi:hypothetical protein
MTEIRKCRVYIEPKASINEVRYRDPPEWHKQDDGENPLSKPEAEAQ